MSGVQHLVVGADEAEQRLDRWFRKQFPHVSQGRIEKMCRKGEIRVEGGRVKPSTRVGPGQSVRVPPLPTGEPPRPSPQPRGPSEAEAEALRQAVVRRDDHLLVLNKPPGLAVQGGSGLSDHLAAGPAGRHIRGGGGAPRGGRRR
ncbi:MAG: S4 domain-containing protein, partial [Pseudomonadota bacterium]